MGAPLLWPAASVVFSRQIGGSWQSGMDHVASWLIWFNNYETAGNSRRLIIMKLAKPLLLLSPPSPSPSAPSSVSLFFVSLHERHSRESQPLGLKVSCFRRSTSTITTSDSWTFGQTKQQSQMNESHELSACQPDRQAGWLAG